MRISAAGSLRSSPGASTRLSDLPWGGGRIVAWAGACPSGSGPAASNNLTATGGWQIEPAAVGHHAVERLDPAAPPSSVLEFELDLPSHQPLGKRAPQAATGVPKGRCGSQISVCHVRRFGDLPGNRVAGSVEREPAVTPDSADA